MTVRAAAATLWARVVALVFVLRRTPPPSADSSEDLDRLGTLTRHRLLVVGDLLDATTRVVVVRLGVAEDALRAARHALGEIDAANDMARAIDAIRTEIDRTLSPAEGRLGAVLRLLPARDEHVMRQISECAASLERLARAAREARETATRLSEIGARWCRAEARFNSTISDYWRRAVADGALLKRASHVTTLAAADRLIRDLDLLIESCERRRVAGLATADALSAACVALDVPARTLDDHRGDIGIRVQELSMSVLAAAHAHHDLAEQHVGGTVRRHVAYARDTLYWALKPAHHTEVASTRGSRLAQWAELRSFHIGTGPAADEPDVVHHAPDDEDAQVATVVEVRTEGVDAVEEARGPIDCPIRVEASRRYGAHPKLIFTVRYAEGGPESAQLVTPPGIALELADAIDTLRTTSDMHEHTIREIALRSSQQREMDVLDVEGLNGSRLTLIGDQRAHFAAALRRLA